MYTDSNHECVPTSYLQSHLLNPQCKLKWRRGADLPVAMSRPHLVKIRNNIFCGGGITGNSSTARLVFKYDPTADSWSALPPCPTHSHGLSELSYTLVSVGGVMHDDVSHTPTKSVYIFQDPNWVTCISLPPMPTARYNLSTFTYNTHLIACGGLSSINCYTNTVEMLNSDTGQWSTLARLPITCHTLSIALTKRRCYLFGGTDLDTTAFSAPLPLLMESTSQPALSSAVWEFLPNCPLYASTAAELGGCVLCN